jgi:hypothetical protein
MSSHDGGSKCLNIIGGMMGFFVGMPLKVVDSVNVARSMYQQVFYKCGLLRLLDFDSGSNKFHVTFEAVPSLLHLKFFCIQSLIMLSDVSSSTGFITRWFLL